jgi:Tol biopolymer transport system component
MGIDGANPKQITQGDGEFFPTCSPDGKWIYYTPLTGSDRPTLWRIPMDGGDAAQLTDKIAVRPVISPDGKWAACQSSTEQPNTGPKIGIFPVEGGPPQKMLDIPVVQYRWSADSKSILYLDEKGGVSNIWSQSIEGGAPPKQLTNFSSDQIFSFDASKDGKQLALARGYVTTDAIIMKDQGRSVITP